ncbi:glycosyltransferase family 2 protein [Candidatus Woesearchaeota archaeon]|nr:glycosyltransferase family 2 protein [Candidatus Woesearchaeota archaeon]
MATKVSVMMLTYNHLPYTKVALEYAIRYCDYAVEKWILVDNGSTDGTVEWVTKLFVDSNLPYQIIAHPVNKGIAVGQNDGARAADPNSDVVMISNDVFVGPNWLSPLVKCAEWHRERKCKIGWVGPFLSPELPFDNIVNDAFRKQYFDFHYPRLLHCQDAEQMRFLLDQVYDGDFEGFALEFVQRNRGVRWDEVPSMMFYWTREAINEVGYFDEQFSEFYGRGGWGSEDVDLYFRMNNAGFYRVCTFESFASHLVCGTTRKITLDDAQFAYGDIQTGSKCLRKWIKHPTAQPFVYPYDITPKASKRNYDQWLLRKNTQFGDLTKLDLGLTKEQQAAIDAEELKAQGL